MSVFCWPKNNRDHKVGSSNVVSNKNTFLGGCLKIRKFDKSLKGMYIILMKKKSFQTTQNQKFTCKHDYQC